MLRPLLPRGAGEPRGRHGLLGVQSRRRGGPRRNANGDARAGFAALFSGLRL